SGYDSSIYMHDATWSGTGLDVQNAPWAALRLPNTMSKLDDFFVIGQGASRYGIIGGGNLHVGVGSMDWEDGVNPTRALVDWTFSSSEIWPIPELSWDRGDFGPVGHGAVFFDLHSVAGGMPGRLKLGTGTAPQSKSVAFVRLDGNNVSGTFQASQLPPGCP